MKPSHLHTPRTLKEASRLRPEDAMLDGPYRQQPFDRQDRIVVRACLAGVVLLGESCDPFSVEAVRASMGSIFAVKLARASFDELVRYRTTRGAQMIGASLKGVAMDSAAPAPVRAIVLMGNEQSGLPPEMEAACDLLVKLPMRGRADSLNLAIATGVMLYDLWRRRGYDGARA